MMNASGDALQQPQPEIRWPRSGLLDLLGITHPIVQAPMGQHAAASPGALTAAVSEIGDQCGACRVAVARLDNLNGY